MTGAIAAIVILVAMYAVARLYPAPPTPFVTAGVDEYTAMIERMTAEIQTLANEIAREITPTIRNTTAAIEALHAAFIGDHEPINERNTP